MRSEKQKEEIPFFFLHFSRFFRTFAAHIVYIIIMYSDMKIETKITEAVKAIVEELYGVAVEDKLVQLGQTRPEFEGQLTLVVFPFTKMSHKAPEQTAREIGPGCRQPRRRRAGEAHTVRPRGNPHRRTACTAIRHAGVCHRLITVPPTAIR